MASKMAKFEYNNKSIIILSLNLFYVKFWIIFYFLFCSKISPNNNFDNEFKKKKNIRTKLWKN